MGAYLTQPVTAKNIKQGNSNKSKIRYTLCEMQGWRRNMEDQAITEVDLGDGNSLFAVFDGHGGVEVSTLLKEMYIGTLVGLKQYQTKKYAEALIKTDKIIDEFIGSPQGQKALKQIREKTAQLEKAEKHNCNSATIQKKKKSVARGDVQKLLKKTSKSVHASPVKSQSVQKNQNNLRQPAKQKNIAERVGCTANVVLITPQKFIIANLGDSRSVLCRKDKAIALSFDHKPENATEAARIYSAGGDISGGRINDGLNLSRSFGDFQYKRNPKLKYDEQLVIPVPDIQQIQRTSDDQYILLGCDGIFEKFPKEQTIITRLSNQMKTRKQIGVILSDLMDSILAKDTKQVLGCDNMTAIIIQLKAGKSESPSPKPPKIPKSPK